MSRAITTGTAICAFFGLGLMAWTAGAAELCVVPDSDGALQVTLCDGSPSSAIAAGYVEDSTGCSQVPFWEYCVSLEHEARFMVSTSQIDPDLPFGPIQNGTLYLWLACVSEMQPLGVTEMRFALEGDLKILSFTPVNSFTGAISGNDVALTAPVCTRGPILGAAIQVQEPLDVDGVSWGGTKAHYSGD